MAHLLPVQREYIKQQSLGKTEAMKDAARLADKKVHAELNALRARACNAECFDCSAKKPGWAVLPHGVFVCIDCAQNHRSVCHAGLEHRNSHSPRALLSVPASVGQIGRHISQTKAINTGTYLWFPHELEVMRAVGNGVAARAFGPEAAAAKPSRDAPPEAKLAYARRKYEDCVFGVPTYDKAVGAAAPIAPVPARAPAVTAAAPMAPVAALAPQPKPSAAKADGWELIELFDAPAAPAAPVAVASTTTVTAARATAPASAAPPVAHGCAPALAPAPATAPVAPVGRDTAEVLRLFDPLPPLSQPPRKPTIASDGDAFFANFGL